MPPLSSEAVGFAAVAFEFQNIPNPLSSEAVGVAAVQNIVVAKSVDIRGRSKYR